MTRTALTLLLCTLAGALALPAQSPPAVSPALASLVRAERSFAAMSMERGRREAFLAFFDDDGLFLAPGPTRAKPLIAAWPETQAVALDWEPRFGDVARAGDLGYTTGPFERTSVASAGNRQVTATGWYFTLWAKRDGEWKVALDAGIVGPTSGALRPAPFQARADDGVAAALSRGGSPIAADRALCTDIASGGLAKALAARVTDETIVFRDNLSPLIARAAIASYFASRTERMACEPASDVVSGSADLGYTYGTYSSEGASKEGGYYLRVWKRRGGEWSLAIDLVVPGS